MDGIGHGYRICGQELTETHEFEHQLQAPEDRDAVPLAGMAEGSVVGDSGPPVLAGYDEAQMVLGGERSALLCRGLELGEFRLEDP